MSAQIQSPEKQEKEKSDAVKIERYQPRWHGDILRIWEDSVKATHHFLSVPDFEEIRNFLARFDFASIELFCATLARQPVAFVGVNGGKIEMLFALPAVIGKGIGAALLRFAVEDLRADRVDVNTQNDAALRFYIKHGFDIYETTLSDDQGKPYPLHRMKLRAEKDAHNGG